MTYGLILADDSLSQTDKLVAIALQSVCENGVVVKTNRELGALVCSAETVVSRSLKALAQAGYIRVELVANTKREIVLLGKLYTECSVKNSVGNNPNTLSNNANPLSKNARVPLTKTQGVHPRPLAKTQGYEVGIEWGVSKNARVCESKHAEFVTLMKIIPFETRKIAQKDPINILLYIYNLKGVKAKISFKKKGCGEKTSEQERGYEIALNRNGVPTCKVLHEMCNEYRRDHKGIYSDQLYEDFIRYWSEPNEKQIPRWYRTKKSKNGSFNLAGRLSTWSQRSSGPKIPVVSSASTKISMALDSIDAAGNNIRARRASKQI